MGYPLEKLFGCFFLNGVLIRHPIFWEIRHLENSKRMEIRKLDRKTKGHEKERKKGFWKMFTSKKLDTIEDPHNKHTIEIY